MSKLLIASALVALSVADLEAELKNVYPAETLEEALGLEKAKSDSRKTAIEALENSIKDIADAAAKAEADAAAKAEADAAAKAEADAAAKAEADAAAKAEADAAAKGPVIAKGKSLTSLKGILGEGTPVTPEHFPGGQETFDNLKKSGFIE